ncbi:adenine nucleotide translocase lysine N-methyltransferase isoform X2 [Sarcophilus harrisii]|uniref:adenine nucleotide translocase lysine N-methyltransferase isoform X2 n=1 Tax=Sarcophilus harrisii TaxID=9305 RepID=UPI001301C062|nr:adenine nucleotide translocase lysine N-methyltransferase isoform X2 [Sarcophilus harrisii]
MDQDDPGEAMAELQDRHFGGLGILQVAAGTSLLAYAVWAGLLMPGFRKVPLRLQVLAAYRQGFCPVVGYELNPWLLQLSRFHAWRAGCAQKVSYQKKDLWKVNLADCKNITVFLAPSVLHLLENKLLEELPNETRVISGRFPLPNWEPTATVGEGLDKVWAYDIGDIRQNMETRATAFLQGTPV